MMESAQISKRLIEVLTKVSIISMDKVSKEIRNGEMDMSKVKR